MTARTGVVAKLTAVMVPGRPCEQVSLHDELKRVWGVCGAQGRRSQLKALKTRLSGKDL